MSTPTPWSGPLPILFTQSFMKRQLGVGNLYIGSYASAPASFGAGAVQPYWPGGTTGYTPGIPGFTYGGTIFDNLVTQPGTGNGLVAESASTAAAQAVGTTITTGYNVYLNTQTGVNGYTPAFVQNLVVRNRDALLNFYLEASISRTSAGVPIA